MAGVGLYGVLDYSVLQRRREFGIRMAIGAQGSAIALLVTKEAFAMVAIGAAAELCLSMASGRYIEAMLYDAKATDACMLAILMPALLASLVRHRDAAHRLASG